MTTATPAAAAVPVDPYAGLPAPDDAPPLETPHPDRPAPGGFDRTPPHDPVAEQAVLGAMMLSAAARDDVLTALADLPPGRAFYRPAHELIWDAIAALAERGEPTEPPAVAAELVRRGVLAQAGGPAYLHTLITAVSSPRSAGHYAGIVRDRAALRALVTAGERITLLGYGGHGDAQAAVDAAVAEVTGLAAGPTPATASVVGDLVDETFDLLEQPARTSQGVLTGVADLDQVLLPLEPGQLVVIGARPSVGKSTMLAELARACAIRQRRTCLVFTLEMSRQEWMFRLLAAEAVVMLSRMQRRTLSEDDWHRLARARAQVDDAPLIIDEAPDTGLAQVRAGIRRHRPDLVLIDYLQLMNVGRTGSDPAGRRVAVEGLSRGLKLLAKSEGVPIVTASQLNRGPESRADKRPLMSDLRETGSVEQDADVVMLLHREDMYERESPRAGEIDVIVAKQRNGPTDTVTLANQMSVCRFRSMM